jgi:hypothetical protein
VVAGYDITDLSHAEVIDLVNEDADCGLPAAYPHNVFGVTGALLDGNIIKSFKLNSSTERFCFIYLTVYLTKVVT